MKYLLDIEPYIDYVKSDEYVHPKKDYVIKQMEKIENLIDEEYFDTNDEIEFETPESKITNLIKDKNIDEIEFVTPESKITNLIKDKNLEGLKKLIFQYMKYAVDGETKYDIYYQDIYDDYDESDKDNEDVKKILKILEFHDIYASTVLTGDLAYKDDYYIKNKVEMKYLLDIEPYIDYVNSDEYVHPKKDYVIKQMEKIENLIDEEYFDTIDEIAIQQGGQYGGMWQRGGFFMTCS
jgi:hypothetical protein